MQHEGERLAYLQALGITQYVPLRPLPGVPQLAEPAWEVELPGDVQPDVAAEALAEMPPALVPPKVPVPPKVMETTPAPVEKTEPAPAPVVADSDIPQLDLSKVKLDDAPRRVVSEKPVPLQRFTLAVLALPGQLRLLVQLSQPDAPGFSAVEFRLLSDLLLALGIKQDIADFQVNLFRWPLVNNPRIAGDVSAARDGLLAFLEGAMAGVSGARIAFLGSAVQQIFPHYAPGQLFTLAEQGNANCVISHSLTAVQQQWQLKPELWHHLQGLL